MIVPISYFDPNNGQTTNLVSRIQSLFATGETSITVKELEKTYTNTPESQWQMVQDVSHYIELIHAQPAPTTAASAREAEKPNKSPYSLAIAAILCFFIGNLGVHRFYVGKVGTGLAQLFTLGCFGIWTLVDFIVILCGAFKDQEGRRLMY